MAHAIPVVIRPGSVWARIDGPLAAVKLVQKTLTVDVPGARHTRGFKAHRWAGKHRSLRAGANTSRGGLAFEGRLVRLSKIRLATGATVQNTVHTTVQNTVHATVDWRLRLDSGEFS